MRSLTNFLKFGIGKLGNYYGFYEDLMFEIIFNEYCDNIMAEIDTTDLISLEFWENVFGRKIKVLSNILTLKLLLNILTPKMLEKMMLGND